ncbi:MAG: cation-transporting P-type ATPase, partial [Verrucomicrobiae bacterium]|nr:cation-transporting P-type ATPase [Verrucomicrobiae bacterium]
VDESALTGESAPVAKSTAPNAPDTPLADRTSMLCRGGRVTRGTARGLVTATGLDSELGKISALVAGAKRESTPLEERLDQLGNRLVWLTLAVAAATAAVGVFSGKDLYLMARTALALAVAAIPEGLPVVATIALARGLWRMAERNALINRLSAVETLGATGVICTDKTGTLTENRLRAVRCVVPTAGEIDLEARESAADPDDETRRLLRLGVLCNNAEPGAAGANLGDPLEAALLAAAAKAGIDPAAERGRFVRLRELPFESETRLMGTVHADDALDGARLVAVKGAPEAVLAACRLTPEERERWLAANDRLAGEGLRVLAFAGKTGADRGPDVFRDLDMAGLCGLIDPPRDDVPEAIRECREAGIRVVMVTGDQARTGVAIAGQIGLGEENGDAATVLQGSEMEAIDADSEDGRRRLLETSVFARVTPAQKLALVHLHQENGAIVAMTGDGVNDAPALKQADIGIAMGKRGTEVAREAAEMVLRDDAFPSIVVAIRQGRTIFSNIRKFVVYLLSCNLSEIFVVGAATVFFERLPILPLQILFLNLVTDVFPALALGVGHAGSDLMRDRPRPAAEPIVRPRDWRTAVAGGAMIAAATLGADLFAIRVLGQTPEQSVTVAFLTLAAAQLAHVFNMAGGRSPYLRSEIATNPAIWAAVAICAGLLGLATHLSALAGVLGLHAPGPAEWGAVAGFGSVPVVVEILRRLARRKRP